MNYNIDIQKNHNVNNTELIILLDNQIIYKCYLKFTYRHNNNSDRHNIQEKTDITDKTSLECTPCNTNLNQNFYIKIKTKTNIIYDNRNNINNSNIKTTINNIIYKTTNEIKKSELKKKYAINYIKTHTLIHNKLNTTKHDDTMCCICLNKISNNTGAGYIKSCGHNNFCLSCILKWVKQKQECPMCRSKIICNTTNNFSFCKKDVKFNINDKKYIGKIINTIHSNIYLIQYNKNNKEEYIIKYINNI
jgi:hypothetical protein